MAWYQMVDTGRERQGEITKYQGILVYKLTVFSLRNSLSFVMWFMVVIMSMMVIVVMVVMIIVSSVGMSMMVVVSMVMMVMLIGLPGVLERRRLIVRVSVVESTLVVRVTMSLGQRGQRKEQDHQEESQGNGLFVGLLGNLDRLLLHLGNCICV